MSAFPNVSFLLCTALIAITLAVSGFAKAKDPSSTVTGILNLGLEKIAPLKLTARTLPWAELLLALGMLAAPGALFTVISGISLMLMLFYLIVIARALATGRTAGCNCFGSKSAAPVSRYTLIRNRSGAYRRAVQPQRCRLGLGARRRPDRPHHVGGTTRRGIG